MCPGADRAVVDKFCKGFHYMRLHRQGMAFGANETLFCVVRMGDQGQDTQERFQGKWECEGDTPATPQTYLLLSQAVFDFPTQKHNPDTYQN